MSVLEFDVGTLVTAAGLLVAGFWGVGKLLLRQFEKNINAKFGVITTQLREQKESQQQEYTAIQLQLDEHRAANLALERRLNESELQRERDFVRRDDFNRVIASFQVSVDHLRLQIDRSLERLVATFGGKGQ